MAKYYLEQAQSGGGVSEKFFVKLEGSVNGEIVGVLMKYVNSGMWSAAYQLPDGFHMLSNEQGTVEELFPSKSKAFTALKPYLDRLVRR